jgi:predicted RNA binding protein YcfA (HicA-like mRNA interferase family)
MSRKEKLFNRLMNRRGSLSVGEVVCLLNYSGFTLMSVRGSHHKFFNSDLEILFVLPVHDGRCKRVYIDSLYKIFIKNNLIK